MFPRVSLQPAIKNSERAIKVLKPKGEQIVKDFICKKYLYVQENYINNHNIFLMHRFVSLNILFRIRNYYINFFI